MLTWRRNWAFTNSWKKLLIIWTRCAHMSNCIVPPSLLRRKSAFLYPLITSSWLRHAIVPPSWSTSFHCKTACQWWSSTWNKTSPAIRLSHEAIYYESQLVLEVTLLSSGLLVVLGIPMNSKSSTFDIYLATTVYQTNADGETASFFLF